MTVRGEDEVGVGGPSSLFKTVNHKVHLDDSEIILFTVIFIILWFPPSVSGILFSYSPFHQPSEVLFPSVYWKPQVSLLCSVFSWFHCKISWQVKVKQTDQNILHDSRVGKVSTTDLTCIEWKYTWKLKSRVGNRRIKDVSFDLSGRLQLNC